MSKKGDNVGKKKEKNKKELNNDENTEILDNTKEKNDKKTKKNKMSRKELKAYRKENNIPTLWTYLKDYKFAMFSYILITAISIGAGVYTTILAADALADVTEGFYRNSIIKFAITTGLRIFSRILNYLLNLIYFKYSTKIVSRMNNDLSYQAFKFSATTYANNSTGTFVLRIVDDPNRIITQITSVVDIIGNIIASVIITIYILTLNYMVGLSLVACAIICYFIENYRIKLRKKNRRISNKKRDKINSLTTEIVKSERDIKSLGLENKLKTISKEYYDDYNSFNYKMSMQNTSLVTTRTAITFIFSFIALLLGIILLEKSLLVLASFMVIYTNRSSIINVISFAGNLFDIISDVKVYGKRVFELFDKNVFPVETFGAVDLQDVKGEIEFKNVSYAYEDKLKNKDDLNKEDEDSEVVKRDKVLENLSFKIEPNTTVAFVGKSGSGKSTILSLMSKMYSVDEGEVLIDGININDLSKECLRNNISLVNQFPYIFDMTIYENLLMAKGDATEQEVNEAIEKSYLKEFIDGLADGINTVVGESGIKLSGGQRQRLAIARALLRKSRIIIFDESTSSLDNVAQEYVKKSIDNLKGSSTIVIVAHRLSTIKNVDKIFFLEDGKITDSGTFKELFDNNEHFHHMFLAEEIE